MHIKGINARVFITLLLLLQLTSSGLSQEKTFSRVRVMFYNVENLFDTQNDSLTNDDDFLPRGVMRWNSKRYTKKINSVYKAIIAAGEWNPPDIVGFCEVENRKVLEDLIFSTYLSKHNYGIVHEESPDIRGIDVCLIYRKDFVSILDYQYWIPEGINKIYSSRSVLYVGCKVAGDTIHLIVNHWPSRRGGVLAGERLRAGICRMIRMKADSITLCGSTDPKFIIMGDFNCTPEDNVMQSLVNSSLSKTSDRSALLVNLTGLYSASGTGTYRYMGTWEMIDQIIVSKSLLNGRSGLYTRPDLFRIFNPGFLLKKDPVYPGLSPYSTYRGYRYQGGYSDHLPVILDFYAGQPD